jgi:hypothetical protein
MRGFCLSVLLIAMLTSLQAEARSSGSASGSVAAHHGGGRQSSGTKSKASSKYFFKKCKSPNCFKKHPSGHYAVPKKK